MIKNNLDEKAQKKPNSPLENAQRSNKPPKVTREKTRLRTSNNLSKSVDSVDLYKSDSNSENRSVHFASDTGKPKSGRTNHSRSNSSGSGRTANLEPIKHTPIQRTLNIENTLIEELNKRWPKRSHPGKNETNLDSVLTGRGLADNNSASSNSSVRTAPGKLIRQKTIAVPYHRDKSVTSEPSPGITPRHNSFFPDSEWLAHVHR